MLKVYRHILIEKRMEREMNAFAKTDVGIERAVNQDYVYAKLDSIGCLPNLFVVADGCFLTEVWFIRMSLFR